MGWRATGDEQETTNTSIPVREGNMIEPASKAPDFCLISEDGEEICLKDLKGQWLVLYFYPKDNTSG
jgi:cytochrome oxidase Cu insertion factor (SCO1/SenC/PrrC family)